MVRESELEALERTLVYMKQEAKALDLKEYYQERRLNWMREDEVGFGGTRVPTATTMGAMTTTSWWGHIEEVIV